MARSLDVIDPSYPDPPVAHDGPEGVPRICSGHVPGRSSGPFAGRGPRGWGILILALALLGVAAGWSHRAEALDASGAFPTFASGAFPTFASGAASRLGEPYPSQATEGARDRTARLRAGIASASSEPPRRKMRATSRAPVEALVAARRFAAEAAARPERPQCPWTGPLEREPAARAFMSQGPPFCEEGTIPSHVSKYFFT